MLRDGLRKCNDFTLSDTVVVVSGSNMSGKTTFLRTVGINALLARTGSFVCAEEMTTGVFDVMTSMRIGDDLEGGISTFRAELTRIKGILDECEKSPRILFLIDEIFRGTNSVDRLAGARAVITRLNERGAVGLISTHDLELCALGEGDRSAGRIRNYHFSEQYEGGTIRFDYRLRKGASTTTNAKFLLEMVGIL